MNIQYLFFISVLFFSGEIFSQEIDTVASKPVTPEQVGAIEFAKELPIEGTYQIVFKNGTPQYAISNEILFQVNEKRGFGAMVIINVDVNTEIRILPYQTIYSEDFVPVPTYIFE